MDVIGFAIVAVVVAAFFGLIAWLRSGSGEMRPPGEPGDADKFPRIDGS
jgi:hypothetical protein